MWRKDQYKEYSITDLQFFYMTGNGHIELLKVTRHYFQLELFKMRKLHFSIQLSDSITFDQVIMFEATMFGEVQYGEKGQNIS